MAKCLCVGQALKFSNCLRKLCTCLTSKTKSDGTSQMSDGLDVSSTSSLRELESFSVFGFAEPICHAVDATVYVVCRNVSSENHSLIQFSD